MALAKLLPVVLLLCTACTTATLTRHTVPRPTQVAFEPVVKVPHCADYFGTGPRPPEGHAALFVQLPAATTMYYETALAFDAAGWVAEDVRLGEVTDVRHFTLYLYALPAEADEQLRGLPHGTPVPRRATRLLDVMTVIRTNTPDTC